MAAQGTPKRSVKVDRLYPATGKVDSRRINVAKESDAARNIAEGEQVRDYGEPDVYKTRVKLPGQVGNRKVRGESPMATTARTISTCPESCPFRGDFYIAGKGWRESSDCYAHSSSDPSGENFFTRAQKEGSEDTEAELMKIANDPKMKGGTVRHLESGDIGPLNPDGTSDYVKLADKMHESRPDINGGLRCRSCGGKGHITQDVHQSSARTVTDSVPCSDCNGLGTKGGKYIKGGFAYTHLWRDTPPNAGAQHMVVNASTESVEEAEEALRRGHQVVIETPEGSPSLHGTTIGGRKVVTCPEQYDNLPKDHPLYGSGKPAKTCSGCTLCRSDHPKRPVIEFGVHGATVAVSNAINESRANPNLGGRGTEQTLQERNQRLRRQVFAQREGVVSEEGGNFIPMPESGRLPTFGNRRVRS